MKRRLCSILLVVLFLSMLTGCVMDQRGSLPNTTGRSPQPSLSAPPTTGTTVPTTTAPMDDPYQIQRYDYHLGETITITLTPAQSSIQDSELEYGWASINGVLYAKCFTAPYRFEYVNGSDRYVTVTMEGGQTYRIDVQTGDVFDPESILGDLPLSTFTFFTSDGQYAVLSCGNSLCVLLNCVTGEVTQLAYEEDAYAVWAKFMDDNHVLICSRYKTDVTGKESLTLAVYNISTGEYKQIPGEYQSEDPAEENYLFVEENCAVYTFVGGQLTVMDLLTGQSVAYPFGYDVFVDYNRHGMLMAVVNDTEYVLYKDGTYQEIIR